jgi:hypothetical protein
MDLLLFVMLLIAACLCYLIPTFVAVTNKHKYVLPIFIANLFFGVTIVGWAALLIFAILKEFRVENKV